MRCPTAPVIGSRFCVAEEISKLAAIFMNLVERMSAPLSQYLLFAILLGSMLLLLMPWTPWMPVRGIDASWCRTLDYAFESRFQFGPELAFVYGPLGFVQADLYSPGSYPW